MAELKPCPFCGRVPNTQGCKPYGYYVVCDCGIEQSRIYKQKCDAVKHWNRRKTEPSNSEKPNNSKDEPQYEMGMGTLKCDNCSEYGSFKCTKCDGEMYFKRLEPKDEPQTEGSRK